MGHGAREVAKGVGKLKQGEGLGNGFINLWLAVAVAVAVVISRCNQSID